MWCFACHVFRAWLITAFVLPFGMSYSCRWMFGLCFLLVKATFNRYRPECVCYMHLCPPPSPPRFEKDPPPVLSKCARSNAFLQQHLFPQNLLRKWRNLFHQLFNWAVTTMKWLKMNNMPSCICRHARGQWLRSGFRHRDPFQKFATHCWTWKWHGGFLKRRLSNTQVYKCCW